MGRGEEHRGCAGRTRRRGTCLCVSHLSQPLLPSGSERSVLMWGGPELQLLARMAGRTFPVGIMWHPQGSLITRATGQARLPPALRLLFPGPSTSAGPGFSPAHPPGQTRLLETVAFEVQPCPGPYLPLALSGIRTHLLRDVASCPPASWPPDRSQLRAFWGHDSALTQQQKFGFFKNEI